MIWDVNEEIFLLRPFCVFDFTEAHSVVLLKWTGSQRVVGRRAGGDDTSFVGGVLLLEGVRVDGVYRADLTIRVGCEDARDITLRKNITPPSVWISFA